MQSFFSLCNAYACTLFGIETLSSITFLLCDEMKEPTAKILIQLSDNRQ